MSNIRLFFSESLSVNLRAKLEKSQSHYLTKVMRVKKNEPSFIKYTAKKLAELKNIEVKKIIELTTKNFNNLFFN